MVLLPSFVIQVAYRKIYSKHKIDNFKLKWYTEFKDRFNAIKYISWLLTGKELKMKIELRCNTEEYDYDVEQVWGSLCGGCQGVTFQCLDCPMSETGEYWLCNKEGKKLDSWWPIDVYNRATLLKFLTPDCFGEDEKRDVVIVKVPEELFR